MLEMRPSCECCGRELPADREGAYVCSFECTFCAACVAGPLAQGCPNCGGELLPRPRRPAAKLERYPASSVRVEKPAGC